jgi:hypothetical protein
MTIQVSMSLHANGDDSETQKVNEAAFVEELRAVVRKFADAGNEVYGAQASTQQHGMVNLVDAPEVVDGSPGV